MQVEKFREACSFKIHVAAAALIQGEPSLIISGRGHVALPGARGAQKVAPYLSVTTSLYLSRYRKGGMGAFLPFTTNGPYVPETFA